MHKVLGSVAALGKQDAGGEAFSGELTQMSDELKEDALIESLYWQCVSSRDDINEWEFGMQLERLIGES